MLRHIFAVALLGIFSQHLLAAQLPDFTEMVEKQGPGVVNISTTPNINSQSLSGLPKPRRGDPFSDFFRRYEQPVPREQEPQSRGSGFIISEDGYVLTNAHVVSDAGAISVRLTDKREFKAKIIGTDKRTDLALLKIEARGLPKIVQGNSNALKVGEWVVAIGSPFGFDSSVTAGIVSAKGRSLPHESFIPFIQTDVAINPGNSGGPLFNMKGEVVGINSQIYTRTGGSMGLSFAIPIDVAMDVANQLRVSGKVTRGRIGVVIQEMTLDLAESFGLNKATGALISSVEKGGPADKSGIQASDVILKFDGTTIASSFDLPRIVGATRPGTKVTVSLWRKGASHEVQLMLGEMPDDGTQANLPNQQGKADAGESFARLGLVLSELSDVQKQQLNVDNGLLVEEVKSATTRAGLERGDILLALGNIKLQTLDQFNEALKHVPKGRSIALLVRRGDGVSYIAIRPDEK